MAVLVHCIASCLFLYYLILHSSVLVHRCHRRYNDSLLLILSPTTEYSSQDACAADSDHPLVCVGQKGRSLTTRHHLTVDALYVSTLHAGGLAIKEPTNLSGQGDHSRPDLQLVVNGQQCLVDVTIRHPGCKTNIANGSAREQLAAAAKGEAEKKAKYTDMAQTQQASFLPFAVETYGGLGKSARKLIKQIASAAEDQMQMLTEEEIREELRGSVAIAIQKGNAMIMLSAYHKAIGVSARTRRGFGAVAA